MDTKTIELVQDSFKKVAPIADTTAKIFYDKLFELDPKLQSLFKGDMKEQGRKLMSMIGLAVNGLRDVNALLPAVQKLGQRHVGYGVQDQHYDIVGQALLDTLAISIGETFTYEVKTAWTEVYEVLATTMKNAAA